MTIDDTRTPPLDEMTNGVDPIEPLDIETKQLARVLPFVADDGCGRIESLPSD